MRSLVLFLLFFIPIFGLKSQSSYNESYEFSGSPKIKSLEMIGADDRSIYCFVNKRTYEDGEKYFLQKIAKDSLEEQFLREIQIIGTNPVAILKIFPVYSEKRFNLIYSVDHLADKTLKIYARRLDFNGAGTEVKELASIFYDTLNLSTRITLSRDSSKILFSQELSGTAMDAAEKNFSEKIKHAPANGIDTVLKARFTCIDSRKLETEWQKEFDEFNSKPASFSNFKIDGDGNLCFIVTTPGANENPKQAQYHIVSSRFYSNAFITSEIKLPENYVLENFDILPSDNPVVNFFGMFKDLKEKTEKDQIDHLGVFSGRINLTTGSIEKKEFHFFKGDILKYLNASKKDRNYYYRHDYTFNTANDFIFVVQRFKMSEEIESGKTPSGRWRTIRNYNMEFKDVVAISIRKENSELNWIKTIPVRIELKTGEYPMLQPYTAFIKNDELVVFYNEHPKNFKDNSSGNYNPSKLKAIIPGVGSRKFVEVKIDLLTAKTSKQQIFEADKFGFRPIKVSDFLVSPENTGWNLYDGNNALFLFSEDGTKGKFYNIKL